MSGNLIAQAIAFASYFIVTRLFSPEDIGIYNIFFSYIEVLIIFSTGKYEMAAVLADNDREAMAVSQFAMRTNLIVSLLLFALIPIVALSSQFTVHDSQFALLLLVPPMVFFCGTTRVYSFLFNRKRSFLSISISDVVGATTGFVLKVAFGFVSRIVVVWCTLGLPLATVIGKAAANINYLLRLRQLDYPKDVSVAERRSAARKFRNFPLYTMPKEFISSLSANLPLLWLALYFDKAEVGLFALALTFTFRPVNILNSVFEKLFNVRVAEMVRQRQRIGGYLGRIFLVVNLAALPVFLVVFFFGGDLFAFLFGDKWDGCGYYIRCLLPWTFVVMTSTSLSFLFGIFGKQRTEFIFFLVLLILRVAAMLAGIHYHSFRLGILLFSLSGAAVYLALIVWYALTIRRYERTL